MQRIGSRAQVMHGNAKQTGGGLKKKDLKYNKQGKIVSKKMSAMAKNEKRLQKAGNTTKKKQFGSVKNMKGGNNQVIINKYEFKTPKWTLQGQSSNIWTPHKYGDIKFEITGIFPAKDTVYGTIQFSLDNRYTMKCAGKIISDTGHKSYTGKLGLGGRSGRINIRFDPEGGERYIPVHLNILDSDQYKKLKKVLLHPKIDRSSIQSTTTNDDTVGYYMWDPTMGDSADFVIKALYAQATATIEVAKFVGNAVEGLDVETLTSAATGAANAAESLDVGVGQSAQIAAGALHTGAHIAHIAQHDVVAVAEGTVAAAHAIEGIAQVCSIQ